MADNYILKSLRAYTVTYLSVSPDMAARTMSEVAVKMALVTAAIWPVLNTWITVMDWVDF